MKCPEYRQLGKVGYCASFDTECREKQVGKGNLVIVRVLGYYDRTEQVLLCNGKLEDKIDD